MVLAFEVDLFEEWGEVCHNVERSHEEVLHEDIVQVITGRQSQGFEGLDSLLPGGQLFERLGHIHKLTGRRIHNLKVFDRLGQHVILAE